MADDLFKTEYTKAADGSGELFQEEIVPANDDQVTCLGMTFPNDAARREYFTEELRKKLQDPEFRKIEGFPIGKDEDILALSDPPYYCACPNPWIGDFIKAWEREKPPKDDLFHYLREPFAADVSEGKNDPIYNAHSYHTKVPHKAIMRYILHYTEPGDIVFDGFCGTGMTGVAAQLCGDINQVRSLGYRVDEKTGNIYDPDAEDPTKPISRLGARKAVLNDLSPAATFIAYNYNTPVDVAKFEREAKRILAEVEAECGWMYETQHVDQDGNPVIGSDGKPVMGKINYVVWSDVFICPECVNEFVFWDAAIDPEAAEVKDQFSCPHCNALLNKKNVQHAWIVNPNSIDDNGTITKIIKQTPVIIDYEALNKRHRKNADAYDLDTLRKIADIPYEYWYPNVPLKKGDKTSDPMRVGVSSVADFFTIRNLKVLSCLYDKISDLHLLGAFTAIMSDVSRMGRVKIGYYFKGGGGPFIPGLNGTLYIPSLSVEKRVLFSFANRVETFIRSLLKDLPLSTHVINTSSTGQLDLIPDNSLDYLFWDPPFGSNIMYSELNVLWESWIKVHTNSKQEAIENKTQQKNISDYRQLMELCFIQAHRKLKPGRWLTVEFSNTSAAVWNSIQEALSNAGFIVANVSALDKKQGSFNAVTNPTSVKQDLVISAYKPNGGFEERFITEVDTEEGIWDFVRTHLKYLPVAKIKGGRLITVRERDPRLLFDQLVAYYVRKGYNIPISSQDFQAGLAQRFDERDGLYYLPEQAIEYDKKKAMTPELVTGDLFVSDEASAIAWLRKLLKARTLTFQEINPLFMQELSGWNKHEVQLELSQLLEENFLMYDGKGEVPSQIHTYLSSNWHDLRELAKNDPKLVAKAENRWYVPDPNKAGDLEKVREKSLLREFEEYRNATKKLKTFRLEAIRAGFKHAFQEHDYATILSVGRKIPEDVLEEDDKLLMWFNQAGMRVEG